MHLIQVRRNMRTQGGSTISIEQALDTVVLWSCITQ